MNLEELLERFPWIRTRDILWAEPPPLIDEPLAPSAARAIGELIERHRASQLDVLMGVIVTPVLASPTLSTSRTPDDGDHDLVRVLRSPRSSGRLFIERVVRVGKDLRKYSPEAIERLGGGNAELGKFLRTVALAGERRGAERFELQSEWWRISPEADLGVVLTPMTHKSADRGSQFASEATGRLVEALLDGLERQAIQVVEDVPTWTAGLVREGAARLTELRGMALR